MDIINIIEFQLTEIRKLFHNDLENGTVTHNYLIAENQCKFLDVYKLKKYLTETRIENLTSLKFICLKCIDIIELWNYKLEFLPDSKIKERFSKGQIISAVLDFHAIYLLEDKIINYNTHLGKETFVEENEYQVYQITKITSICFNILNFILTSYPKIKADFKPQYYLLHYKKTKSFNFQQVLKPYSKTEFIEFENHLEKYLLRYHYIFDNLETENKLEFKNDVLDHLKDVHTKQIHSKYKKVLKEAITSIKDDFSDKNDEAILVKRITPKNKTDRIFNALEDWFFFQVVSDTNTGKEWNNDSIITPENWENYKDVFFEQRVSKQKDSIKLSEKIELELEDLKNLIINKPDYKVLKQRYKDYLNNALNSEKPQQAETKKTDEVKKELHNHIFKGNAFEVWQSMFDEFSINDTSRTDVKFMFEEMKQDGFIHDTVNQVSFLQWIFDSYDGLMIEKTSNHSRTDMRLKAYSRAKKFYKN